MKPRLSSIQIIRAIAFILIFLSHVELLSTGPIGVSLFLVLSGFCMTYAYLDRPEKMPIPSVANNLKFVWGKIKKLYPLHLVTLLFVALIIFGEMLLRKGSEEGIVEQGVYFVANGLLLQSWIPWRDGYFSFNAVSWYLSTIAFSYFLFPWVFKTIQSKNKIKIARLAGITISLMILIAIILGIGKHIWGWSNALQKWVTYISPFYRVGDFIVGLVAGYLFVTFKDSWEGVQHTAAEIIIIILIVIQVVLYNSGVLHSTNWMLTLFWLPSSVVCVYFFAVNKGIVSRLLSERKILVWIGNISGEAFLIHQICIKAAEYVTKNKCIVTIIAFTVTVIAALIWKWLYRKVQTRVISK